ncbi:hypothetical protein G4228_001141 [Cervus hanglu yarkandensis]|nr:hypothetical protein G4228_001141 [Cervus hanglu yarkandensis]
MGVCGSLFLPWKCLVVVSLRLLFLVPTGVPVRSGDATFPKAMDNVTVRQGESATLSLSEEKGEIKDMRVPWTEPKRASVIKGLSFDERKTRVNYEINRKARHLIDEKSNKDFFKKETIVRKTKCLLISRVQRPTGFTNTIGDINEKSSSPR